MPQFILDQGNRESEAWTIWNDSSDFVKGYIEALFFTESGELDDELHEKTVSDFAPDTLRAIQKDCADFEAKAAELLSVAYLRGYDEEQAGRDFWLTRNGHGAGYWDRDQLSADDLGDKLTSLCQYREISPVVGDDGLIYMQ